MAFPDPEHKKNPVNNLKFFDYEALCLVMKELPEPVIARLINMCDNRVRGTIMGAVDSSRADTIKTIVGEHSQPDPEKDDISNRALIKFTNDLIKAGKIKRDGQFYCGS